MKMHEITRKRIGGAHLALVAGRTIGKAAAFAICATLLSAPAIAGSDVNELIVELNDVGHDFVIDEARERVYVSMTTRNEVAVVSMSSWQVIDRIFVGSRPRGIDLSSDGSTVYVALNGSGSVAMLDIETREVDEVVVASLLDAPVTWDVLEGAPGEVFVTSNPSSGGFAYVVRIDRNNNNSATRVASNRIIRAAPTLAKDPFNEFMYVGEGFSPNSLYKLDIRDETAPIVLEDDHGSVSGTTTSLTVSSDGTRILTGSGQWLRTGSLTQAAVIGSGASTLSEDDNFAYVINQGFSDPLPIIETYNMSTFLLEDSYVTSDCNIGDGFGVRRTIKTLPGGDGWLVLGNDLLCVLTTVPPRSLQVLPAGGQFLKTNQFDVSLVLRAEGHTIMSLDGLTVNGVPRPDLVDRCITGFLVTGEPILRCPQIGRGILKATSADLLDLAVNVTLDDGSTIQGSAAWEILDVVETRPPVFD